MNLQRINPPDPVVSIQCVVCLKLRSSPEMVADLDAPAGTYYCAMCRPTERASKVLLCATCEGEDMKAPIDTTTEESVARDLAYADRLDANASARELADPGPGRYRNSACVARRAADRVRRTAIANAVRAGIDWLRYI